MDMKCWISDGKPVKLTQQPGQPSIIQTVTGTEIPEIDR
jgi:hypothetical protein